MFPSVLIPLIAALVLSIVVTTTHRRLPPALAARVVTISLIVVLGAALPTLWIVSLGYLAHVPFLDVGLSWCAEIFGPHQRIPSWVGAPSLFLAAVGTVRATKVAQSYRRLRHDLPGAVEIVGHDQPFAVALPGRGGHVVLSTGLLSLLDEREQAVVLAHERAHARHRHDRYLLVAKLAAASLPMTRPLTSRVQFSLERWADEAAVTACGDRGFVAMTLGKVALHNVSPAGILGFTGLGVTARVAALLSPAPTIPGLRTVVILWAAIALTAVLALFQLHHLASLLTALCPD